MSEGIRNAGFASDNTQTARPDKVAYHRPQLIRYGELASLTQSGPSTSATEFFTTFSPISQQP